MSYKSDLAIYCHNLSKHYPIFTSSWQKLKSLLFKKTSTKQTKVFKALDKISFVLEKGKTLGIIGANGAGKSTLLQLVTGISKADGGIIQVNGRIAALLELGAGFNAEFTGKENIYINAALLGMSSQEIEQRMQSIIDFSELNDFIDKPVKTYSSGMYVRLAFAIAINVEPDILIVDEALSVGDARFQAKCFERIKTLKKQGVTLLFCSHDIHAIKQFCDQVLWLDHGIVQQYGEPLEVCSNYMAFCFSTTKKNSATKSNLAPINHWGENQGSILGCTLQNDEGKHCTIFHDQECIAITMQFSIPHMANLNDLSISFAIRSLSGVDLIVHSTCEEEIKFQSSAIQEINFQFKNCLNEGHYILVAILEERQKFGAPKYHEFIEGIAYFSIVQSKTKFGLFLPEINFQIQNTHKCELSKSVPVKT